MELKLYDTYSREKRTFMPLDPANVRMYVCGPTVYDFAHIGNARPVIVFDVLFRLLRHIYGADRVTYVRNITDVDDKINDRAARDFPGVPLNEAIRRVTTETERQFHADTDALGSLRPTVEPRATEHITEMRAIIERLIADGHAYVAEGHVLFAVATMPSYGRLARRSLDEMMAGARVDVAAYKRSEMDFVLWKPSKPGEPSWPSPGGIKLEGRPGWHIECSAMAWKHLGERFDIHGGGIDLVFPHHENELAQTCCAFHEDSMANFWMHNGFLRIEGEKMSKSLGNFVTIRQLLADWPGDVLRLTMMKAHYRQPIDWRRDELERSQAELRSWSELIFNMALEPIYQDPDPALVDQRLLGALCDDLNVPLALARFHELADQARKDRTRAIAFAANAGFLGFSTLNRPGYFTSTIVGHVPVEKRALFVDSQRLISNFHNSSANNFSITASSTSAELQQRGVYVQIGERGDVRVSFSNQDEPFNVRIERKIAERAAARARKDFKESDRIRDELSAMGVVLKDGKGADGKPVTTWEVAP